MPLMFTRDVITGEKKKKKKGLKLQFPTLCFTVVEFPEITSEDTQGRWRTGLSRQRVHSESLPNQGPRTERGRYIYSACLCV